ncbi:MAG: hypothetical protein ACRDJG_03885 [Actinomycetota bacterium]
MELIRYPDSHPENLAAVPARIGPDDLVVDVGGWWKPLSRADHVIDLLPYETRAGGVLHGSRRYLSAWATTPTRELVPPALGCLWLAEASGSDEAACEASLLLAWLADDLGDDHG